MIAEIDRCYLCGESYERANLVLDHEVPVVLDLLKALDVRNLRPACAPCHRTKSNSEQSLAKRNGSTSIGKSDVITEIAPGGVGTTYELVTALPMDNYLANRIFVGSPRR
ncbi:HNH endonuclease [Spirillospora albida]|uniref:HNH endonuclease n=1 Tax=Spirillospora albida TaxID=58123 RepID=UPI001B803CCF|nr:HNH endonuclease signature motif containing protein [Spirillospora albida]